jgi:hypothetical protein
MHEGVDGDQAKRSSHREAALRVLRNERFRIVAGVQDLSFPASYVEALSLLQGFRW